MKPWGPRRAALVAILVLQSTVILGVGSCPGSRVAIEPPVSSTPRVLIESPSQELVELAAGEQMLLQGLSLEVGALQVGGRRETLEAARLLFLGLAARARQPSALYVVKYHLRYLDELLGLASPQASSAGFDELERAGYRHAYGRGEGEARAFLEALQQSRAEPVRHAVSGHPSLRFEAARQLAGGLFVGARAVQRARLFARLGLKGLTVIDYACGTGISLPGLLEAVGPTGVVYAADVAPSVLEFIAATAARDPAFSGWRRVRTLLVEPTGEGLPGGLAEVVVLDGFPIQGKASGVYEDKVLPLVRSLRAALKPGGRVVVWPYFLPDQEMVEIMEDGGFRRGGHVPLEGRVEGEHALVFSRPD